MAWKLLVYTCVNLKTEPWTVVSVLVAAHGQKADAVLNESLRYLRANIDAVIACNTSNLRSLDDDHVKMLATFFDPDIASEIRDKKDLIKSRIFNAMAQKLLEEVGQLYECRFCSKLVTSFSGCKILCLRDRMTVDTRGNCLPRHSEKSEIWKSEDYVKASLVQLGCWSAVYWHLWGRIKFLECRLCGVTFPAGDLQSCRYHPDVPSFAHNPNQGSAAVGTYHCCGQTAVRFDPWQRPGGCRTRDHCVAGPMQEYLVKYRRLICAPPLNMNCENKFEVDGRVNSVTPVTTTSAGESSDEDDTTDDYEDDDDEDDDEDEDDEDVESRKGSPSNVKAPTHSRKEMAACVWDSSKSLRYNQDNLREYERRKMKEIIGNLSSQISRHATVANAVQRPAGGIFRALEDHRKACCVPRAPQFPPKASLLAIARFKRASRRAKTTTTTTSGLGNNIRY